MQTTLLRIVNSSVVRSNFSSRFFNTSSALNMPFKVGDQIPNVELFEGTPAGKVNIKELCKDKKVIIFGVPGAFTPTCSKSHLPSFLEKADELKQKGYEIVCVSINDPFVMSAWGSQQKVDGKIRMLADPRGLLTHALDVEIDLTGPLGSVRTKRFSSFWENGVCKSLEIEPDGTSATCTLAGPFIDKLA